MTPEAKKLYQKKWREANKEKRKKDHKIWCEANKDDQLKKRKEYYETNKLKIKEKVNEYQKTNKDKINKTKSLYRKNRRKTDTLYKLTHNIRSLIQISFKSKNIKKNNKTIDILGCSYEEFKIYIESQFESWMNWENKGLYNGELNYGWDIDHRVPLSSALTEEDVIILNHYTNLQPLCSKVNRDIKRNKL